MHKPPNRVDTTTDTVALKKAMKGMGCDERALIRVLTQSKYANPWFVEQLVHDYYTSFEDDLLKHVEKETHGDLEKGLMAILRGPLKHDVVTLHEAMDGTGTDEEAVNDVLLCRSNADINAIKALYKKKHLRDLKSRLDDEVQSDMRRLYGMVLSATKAEEAAPVIPADIDKKVVELHQATEGIIGANAISVAQVMTSSNAAQIRAISQAYKTKYHRSLEDVIEKEFRGDMEDALLQILLSAENRAKFDAERLRAPILKKIRKDERFVYRLVGLYWDSPRLQEAKQAHKQHFGRPLSKVVKEELSGDYEDLMMALIGKE